MLPIKPSQKWLKCNWDSSVKSPSLTNTVGKQVSLGRTWDSLSWIQTPGTWGTALSPLGLSGPRRCRRPTSWLSAGSAPCCSTHRNTALTGSQNNGMATVEHDITHLASSSHIVVSSEIHGLDGSGGVRKGSYSRYCSVYPSKLLFSQRHQ